MPVVSSLQKLTTFHPGYPNLAIRKTVVHIWRLHESISMKSMQTREKVLALLPNRLAKLRLASDTSRPMTAVAAGELCYNFHNSRLAQLLPVPAPVSLPYMLPEYRMPAWRQRDHLVLLVAFPPIRTVICSFVWPESRLSRKHRHGSFGV